MSPAHSLVAINFKAEIVALQGWDRTRPCGRWSYARPDANLAQGNLNSMPQITASAKSPLASGAAAGGRLLSAPDPALTTHTLDSTVEYRVQNGGMRSSQVAARAGINGQTLRYYERRTC